MAVTCFKFSDLSWLSALFLFIFASDSIHAVEVFFIFWLISYLSQIYGLLLWFSLWSIQFRFRLSYWYDVWDFLSFVLYVAFSFFFHMLWLLWIWVIFLHKHMHLWWKCLGLLNWSLDCIISKYINSGFFCITVEATEVMNVISAE